MKSFFDERYYELIIDNSEKNLKQKVSLEFLKLLAKKTQMAFYKQYGIKPTTIKKFQIGAPCDDEYYFRKHEYGETTKIHWSFSVKIYDSMQAYVCWKSKSGKVYTVSDTMIDEDDIEFWIEDFNMEEYHQHMANKNKYFD
jgi:hypothetical protein